MNTPSSVAWSCIRTRSPSSAPPEDGRQPGAGHADRMAQGERATVDVDDLLGHAQLLHRLEADRGEGLVDLDQIEVLDVEVVLAHGVLDGVRGLRLERVVRAGDIA